MARVECAAHSTRSCVNGWSVGYHAFEVPDKPGVILHDLLTVSLGGVGTITHVVTTQVT